MSKGRRMDWLAIALPALVLAAAIGHLTATRVEGQAGQPTHQTILDSVGAVQTTVNNLKSKLDLIPPAWSQILTAAGRFQLVMGGAAVLDRETGLVWEQSPETATQSWYVQQVTCNTKAVGKRRGWRLPTIQELASLVDPTVSPGPTLPPGHPFSNVQPLSYWSATTAALFTSNAWNAHFGDGGVFNVINKTSTLRVWCVRGGQGVDPQ